MKTKIGVIGPKDSVKRIMYVADEFEEISFFPYTYEQLSDVTDILTNHRYEVDQWLFSGVLNYTYAKEQDLITDEEGTFPPLHGSSFFGILLEAQLTTDKVFKSVSIDTIKNEEIDKILSYYQLSSLTYYNHPFEGGGKTEQLVEFHRHLYEQGKTEVVITSIKDVYYRLKDMHIPVFRVTPSYLSIKLVIQYLEERAQSNRYRNAQVAVIGCRMDFNPDELEELYYSFKTKHQELDLKRYLLTLAEKTNGSLMQLGDGLFFIFTTRGELSEESESDLYALMEEVKLQASIHAKVAIGFGETVSQAEQNVRLGFRHTKHYEKPTILIVDEDQTITLKHQEENEISYQTMETGSAWLEKIKGAALSPGVVSKIISYSNQYGRQEFTSQDLSRWLQSTERNGRRILTEMERVGLVQQCGEAQSGERGRPRKVYTFTTA
ncbi:hypothetical protein GLW05_13145 [Pontibacillus yanchengensis]|uniref:Transcriptional regulator n=1 Tax=Pontibacillus yanchengensis TaxID=462910 RepID=A0A6I5A107_9BACI|nr:hypothetical protein [Pontibacillus yanchengensis]MYL34537.1 hypothetical protein [Pontibacillus yanchengensis]